jgi:hypothetical protein
VALVLGFSVLLASNFPANRTFAWLLSATLAFALVADLLLLPALLGLLERGEDRGAEGVVLAVAGASAWLTWLASAALSGSLTAGRPAPQPASPARSLDLPRLLQAVDTRAPP